MILLLTVGVVLSASLAGMDMSSQDVQLAIAQAQPKALAANRLFEKRIESKTFESWNRAADTVKKYTEKNGRNDSILMKAMDQVEQANNKLINTIKITYNSIFSGLDVSGSEKNRLELTMDFKDIETNMKKVQKDLEQEKFYIPGKQKSKSLILALAQSIEAVATKAMNDISKEVKARGK